MLFGVTRLQTAATDVGLDASALAAVAERAVGVDRGVAPFAGDALRAGEDFALVNNSAAAAGAHDHAENQVPSAARAVKSLGHREAIGVILNRDFSSEHAFEIGFHGLA